MPDPTLTPVDIDAVRDAVDALTDEDIDVTDVFDVERDADDGKVTFTLTCRANTRDADLSDYTP